MNEQEKILREALRLAAHAFAQYALETNTPPDESVDDFVEGFIQQARNPSSRKTP